MRTDGRTRGRRTNEGYYVMAFLDWRSRTPQGKRTGALSARTVTKDRVMLHDPVRVRRGARSRGIQPRAAGEAAQVGRARARDPVRGPDREAAGSMRGAADAPRIHHGAG